MGHTTYNIVNATNMASLSLSLSLSLCGMCALTLLTDRLRCTRKVRHLPLHHSLPTTAISCDRRKASFPCTPTRPTLFCRFVAQWDIHSDPIVSTQDKPSRQPNRGSWMDR